MQQSNRLYKFRPAMKISGAYLTPSKFLEIDHSRNSDNRIIKNQAKGAFYKLPFLAPDTGQTSKAE